LSPEQTGDSSTTQDALDALNSLLDAKNALVAIWVAYETDRLKLLLDIEALHLDERGLRQSDDLRRTNDEVRRSDQSRSPEPVPRPEPEPIGDGDDTGERAYFVPPPEDNRLAGNH
jgi:hypothetical protein